VPGGVRTDQTCTKRKYSNAPKWSLLTFCRESCQGLRALFRAAVFVPACADLREASLPNISVNIQPLLVSRPYLERDLVRYGLLFRGSYHPFL
jgi:hypothetical protein